MSSTTRLPGIYFETVAPAPAQLLPRMDIAAFAGFLPSGPIGVPFKVETSDRFQEIFGTDQTLAWDAVYKQMQLAQTPVAVRAFFRNGGKRCWVLRLAKNALSNAWVIPGLLQIDQYGNRQAGSVQARSEGSWSDEMLVNAALLENPLPAGALNTSGPAPVVNQALLNTGDMVQLYYQSTQTWAYNTDSDQRWFWFKAVQPGDIGSCGPSPPAQQPDSVTWLGPGANQPLTFCSFCHQGNEMVLLMPAEVAESVPPGSWLQISLGGATLLMQVESMDAANVSMELSPPTCVSPPAGSSPPSGEMATLVSTLGWWVLDPAAAWSANQHNTAQVSVVEFELWATPINSTAMQIANLGFASNHRCYWELMPTDAQLYAPVTQPSTPPYIALADEIDNPRFPLAGTGSTLLGLPIGMTGLPNPDFAQEASMPGGTALNRDGLASYDPSLFLDPLLCGLSSSTLLQNAFSLQYQSPTPYQPGGIYALLSVEDASMLAVPDATLSGWSSNPAPPAALGPPDPLLVSYPSAEGNYTVSWSAVQGASGYLLQQSSDLTFATGITQTNVGNVTSVPQQNDPDCPETLYYRASAYGTAGSGPWSITGSVLLGAGDFFVCNQSPLGAPALTLITEGNRLLLSWTPAPGEADGFTLQTSDDPLFGDSAVPLYQGPNTSFQYWQVPGPAVYFRVNSQRGSASSAWSNTVSPPPEPIFPWLVNQPGTQSHISLTNPQLHSPCTVTSPPTISAAPLMLPVHMAMIRMAAGRGDMVAILSLPLSYQTPDAAAYPALLTAALEKGLATEPGQVLSYAALYHPWLIVTDNMNPPPASLRTVAPDGSVCGAIAANTLSSGAWIAPANIALSNVVALQPLTSDAPTTFFAGQINLIANRPEGFLIESQETLVDLTQNPELEPLNVRRLLILIRRLALREGVRYVFQNITPTFQRQVSRLWNGWMQQLLARGAFAGTSAADSYLVVADQTINPQSSIDQGRFIIQLQIAPSVPMQFLTVQLTQSGGELSLVEM
jgi:hypothetical protein